MLPPGHIAAGYLMSLALIKITGYGLTPLQNERILLLGALMGFIPDLDIFKSFAKIGRFQIDSGKADHRKYITHAPILWLIAGLAIFFVSKTPFFKLAGLVVWLGSWSHFAADSLQYGVMWLWPLSRKLYAIKNPNQDVIAANDDKTGFWRYWLDFIRLYATNGTFSFATEAVLVVASLLVLFKVI